MVGFRGIRWLPLNLGLLEWILPADAIWGIAQRCVELLKG